jgi:S-adenosylmethionine hydrolase
MPECVQTEASISGCIQYVDRFGNLVTNIPETLVQGKSWSAIAAGLTLPSQTTYSDRPKGSAIALIGSHGWVEIAVSSGNAQSQLQLDWGASVQVVVS